MCWSVLSASQLGVYRLVLYLGQSNNIGTRLVLLLFVVVSVFVVSISPLMPLSEHVEVFVASFFSCLAYSRRVSSLCCRFLCERNNIVFQRTVKTNDFVVVFSCLC